MNLTQSSFPCHAITRQPFVLTSDIFYVSASPPLMCLPPFPSASPPLPKPQPQHSGIAITTNNSLIHLPLPDFQGLIPLSTQRYLMPLEMFSSTQADPAGLQKILCCSSQPRAVVSDTLGLLRWLEMPMFGQRSRAPALPCVICTFQAMWNVNSIHS